jgi:hypothetical protein
LKLKEFHDFSFKKDRDGTKEGNEKKKNQPNKQKDS